MLNLSCYRSQKTGFLMSRHMYFLTFSALADCLLSYRTYLEKQATIQEHNRSLDHPVRTVDQFTTVEPRRSSVGVKESYRY